MRNIDDVTDDEKKKVCEMLSQGALLAQQRAQSEHEPQRRGESNQDYALRERAMVKVQAYLEDFYTREVAKRCDLTVEQVDDIFAEGYEKGWFKFD